ncbi:MAG: hypothetical protein ACR2KT_16785 [Methylocella sp.]
MKPSVSLLVASVAVGWTSVSGPLQAGDIGEQIIALDTIRSTANDVCNKVSQIGKHKQAEVSAEAKTTRKGLIADGHLEKYSLEAGRSAILVAAVSA